MLTLTIRCLLEWFHLWGFVNSIARVVLRQQKAPQEKFAFELG